MNNSRSLTTRRGFIAATSFGVVSLYGLWAWFGAASLGWMGAISEEKGPDAHGAHGGVGAPMAEQQDGGGHGTGAGLSPEAFRRLTEDFVRRYALPDGSVRPRGVVAAESGADPHGGGHAMPTGMDHAQAPPPHMDSSPGGAPIDVYLMAFQWGFEPSVLWLDAGTPYRFRMMAVDASHGASIQFGRASRIIRLRRGALVEQEMTFTQSGAYLIYCTVYCGLAHDRMLGRIIVA